MHILCALEGGASIPLFLEDKRRSEESSLSLLVYSQSAVLKEGCTVYLHLLLF